jgi:hypothetical protein
MFSITLREVQFKRGKEERGYWGKIRRQNEACDEHAGIVLESSSGRSLYSIFLCALARAEYAAARVALSAPEWRIREQQPEREKC